MHGRRGGRGRGCRGGKCYERKLLEILALLFAAAAALVVALQPRTADDDDDDNGDLKVF